MKEKLVAIMKHAVATVPFYKEYYKHINLGTNSQDILGCFSELPVLKKKDVRRVKQELVSQVYDEKSLIKEYTSGSTGIPLTIYKNTQEKIVLGRSIWRIRTQLYHITPAMRYARFHMASRENNQRTIIGDGCVSFSLQHLQDEDLDNYVKLLIKYDVEWLFGVPTAIYLIAKYIKDNKIQVPNLRYIELSGEYYQPVLRNKIEEVFQCPVSDLYGLRECYGVALTCSCGNHHILQDNVYVEILDDMDKEVGVGKEGNIYITTLNNFVMPLIRYETGDKGVLLPDHCGCGSCAPVLKLIGGRNTEYFVLPDGRSINSSLFYVVIRTINKNFNDCIYQYRVEQIEADAFKLVLSISSQFTKINELETAFLRIVLEQQSFKGVKWYFYYCYEPIWPSFNGKTITILNKGECHEKNAE